MTSFLLPIRCASPRRVLAAAAVVGVAALVTGCGSPGSSPSATTTVTVTTEPSAPASSGQPAPSPTPAGPAACATRDLRASLGLSQGTAGSSYTNIDFTNIGTTTCTLYGYPGVSLAGGSPIAQIGAAADEDPATPRQLVTLAPGDVANALLRVVDALNVPASRCGPVQSTYLQIYPPNQTTPIYLAFSTNACSKPYHLLTIDAVRPGSGGG